MPQETGYEARVMPQAAAPLPLSNPNTYGAGLGATIGQVGEDLHRREIRAYEAQRQLTHDRETTDVAHKLALHRQNMDGIVRQLRANPTSPDYAEHVKLVTAADDAAREGILSGITEDSVRNAALRQMDAYRTGLMAEEGDYAEGQRIAKTTLDTKATLDIDANRMRQTDKPADLAAALGNANALIDGLQGVTPVGRQKLRDYANQTLTVAFVNHLNDTNPGVAKAMLDAGTFNAVLDPGQIDQLRAGAQVEIRRVEAEAAHQANIAAAATREEIATVQEKASQGIDVSADLPRLAAAAQAMGDTSTVAKLQGLARDSAFAKVWGSVSPLARQQKLQQLQAIPEGKRSEEQQAEIHWLTEKGPALDGQFNDDPVAFAARTAPAGMGPPPIADFSQVELAQREKWMRQAEGAYGHMDLLSDAEATALQQRAVASDAGYREVLAGLRQGLSSRVAMQAVRQMLPQDDFAQSVVALAPNVQRQALDGRELRKANSAILKTPKDDDDAAAQVEGVKAGFNLALGNIPGSQRNGILEVAEAIAADALAKNGKLSEQMSAAMLARSLDAALGSTGSGPTKKGGIGWWGGTMYLLPDRVSQAGFEGHVSRFVRDHPDQAPVNPDGSPADLRRARPLAIGGGRYQFMVGDRVILGKDGKPWIRTVRPK
ncbi:hypothetical protein [Novosphingobium colocasiae]|uniref:hypothetical protein n=1 Tax=Novosphingobium colocasiae TaxID=1256513 RepID=UPI0035B4A558